MYIHVATRAHDDDDDDSFAALLEDFLEEPEGDVDPAMEDVELDWQEDTPTTESITSPDAKEKGGQHARKSARRSSSFPSARKRLLQTRRTGRCFLERQLSARDWSPFASTNVGRRGRGSVW